MAEIFTRVGKLLRIKNSKNKVFTHESETYLTVLVKLPNKDLKWLMFTDSEINKAELRAEKNKEDQPKQSLISLLID